MIYEDELGAAIVGLLRCDYRQDGREAILAVTATGTVRGYLPVDKDVGGQLGTTTPAAAAKRALLDQRAELAATLRRLEQSTRAAS